MHFSCILNNWNKLFLHDLNCIVQDFLYYDMYVGTMWHCALVGLDCLLVHIKWSKTIQLAEPTLHIPVLAIPNSPHLSGHCISTDGWQGSQLV